MRNLLTAAAYGLCQFMRSLAWGTELATAQVPKLRERLVKVGMTVAETVRRVVLHGPEAFVWRAQWLRMAVCCGALSG